MRKHQLEGDVAGAGTDGTRVGYREQSREPRAIIARRGEWWPGEGFGVPQLQGAELPGCFKPKRGEGIGGNDKGGFGALGGCGNADPQANIAARQDQVLVGATVKSGKRFGVLRKPVGEAFDTALNQDGGGEAIWRPVRRGCGGGCVGPDRESSGPIARPDPPVR